MRKLILVLLLIVVSHDAAAKCENSRIIRVRLNGCDAPPNGQDLSVIIGNLDVDLPRVSANVYQGRAGGQTVNPNFLLEVRDQPLCCVPVAKMVPDPCVVEYVAACDTRNPPWTLVARTNDAGIAFDFDFQHSLGGSRTCAPPARRIQNGVKNLGERDYVKLIVKRGNRTAVEFRVLDEDIAKGTLRSRDLQEKLKQMTQHSVQRSGNSDDIIEANKKLLPTSITLVRER